MPNIIPLDPADFHTFLWPLLHRLPLDTILPAVLLLLLYCMQALSSVLFLLPAILWHGGGRSVQIQCTALYSKEGQKSFFPETHGPEIVMEEQPEKHFFWLTLGLHTTGIATVECTASCILSQSLRHETLKVWRDMKMLSLTPTGFFFLFPFSTFTSFFSSNFP